MKMKSAKTKSSISIECLERMSQVLRLLAHPQRLKIIELLENEHEAPVHGIVNTSGSPRPRPRSI